MSSKNNNEVRKLTSKWIFNSTVGLLLVGFGMSVFGEAVILKFNKEPFLEWFGMGTISLIIFNTGLSFFGTAIKYRIYLDKLRKSEGRSRH
jgi:hypothetical protein